MKTCEKILIWIAGIALVTSALLMVANILTRWIFGFAINGTYELVGYFCLLFGSTVVPVGTIARTHVCVDILVSHLPGVPYRIFEYIGGILELLAYAALSYAGFVLAFKKFATGEVSDTLKIPVAPLRTFWAVCAGIAFIVKLIQLILLLKKPTQSKAEREAQA